MTLNEGVGGSDADSNPTAARSVADAAALPIAYKSGIVSSGVQLAKVPIIDLRGYDEARSGASASTTSGAASPSATGSTRKAAATRNQVMWRFSTGLTAPAALTPQSFLTMDTWLSTLVAQRAEDLRQQRAHVGAGRRRQAGDGVRLLLPQHRHAAVDEGHRLSVCDADPKLVTAQVAASGRRRTARREHPEVHAQAAQLQRLHRHHLHGRPAGPPERGVPDRRLRLDQAGRRPAAAGLAADLRGGPRRRAAAAGAGLDADLSAARPPFEGPVDAGPFSWLPRGVVADAALPVQVTPGPWKAPARKVRTSVSRWPASASGWIGVLSWMTRASSRTSVVHGSSIVKRRPVGPSASKTRVSPPLMPFAVDQHDGDEVDAVAMRAFGRRPADAVGGVDAELVRLDEPGLRALDAARRARRTRAACAARPAPPARRRRSARTSARCRRAARCIRSAASARVAARGGSPRRRRRSWRGGAAGSGRRRAGGRRAAARPMTAAARRARRASRSVKRAKPAGASTAWPCSRSAAGSSAGAVVGARKRRSRSSAVARARQRRALARARRAWPRRPRAASAPGRSWCRGTGAPWRRTAAPWPIVSATCSGVSTTSEATSMTPTITSLPSSRRIRSGGTCEWKHSSETWSMRLLASAGNTCSYWRHSPPSVPFQSTLALMP